MLATLELEKLFGEESVLQLFENYLERLFNDKNKPYYGKICVQIITECPFILEYYNYDTTERQWIHRFSKKEVSEKLFTKNGTDLEITKTPALYLVGSTFFNPHTKEEFYWIKVGKSTNIPDRMKGYATHNPMLWKQSFYYCNSKNEMDIKEHTCHKILRNYALNETNNYTEWFQVSREIYLEICDTEWNFFNK